MSDVRLTRYSHGAGCACKLSPDELSEVLGPVRGHRALAHPDLLVGLSVADDAGVFALGDGRALVQTVDIFTPVVDDAYDWGRIAAANALSDIYAMGAEPITALNYLAWPRDQLPFEVSAGVLQGGFDVMAEAGCTVVGGHSVDSPEPSFGFAVTGLVSSDAVVTLAGARPGDILVLTKPLGIGIITTAIKREICPEPIARSAVDTMTRLNRAAGAALGGADAHAATDVTGFGLLGHLREMVEASGVGAVVRSPDVPVLDGARELLEQGAWAGGSKRNFESVRSIVASDVDEFSLRLLADAQTSGGLLVAMDRASVDGYLDLVPGSADIGEIVTGSGIEVV
ncbi:MAG: selenide, water dikinase SelD [Acidimicrobiia bacterium]